MKPNPKFLSDGGFRYEYLGQSYFNLTKWKYFTLRSFIAQEKYRKSVGNKNEIKRIKKLKNLFHGPALVIANGPSVNRISENIIQKFSATKSLFTINNFFNHKLSENIVSNYHFICDNGYWDKYDLAKVDYRNRIKKLQLKNDLVIVQPDYQQEFTEINTLFIRKNPLTGFTKSIDVTKNCGLPNNTSFFAIATAIYLGYSPIYVAGLDLNFYNFIDFDNKSGWGLKSHHSYDLGLERIEMWQYRDSVTRILNSNLMQIYYLKLFKNHDVRIINDRKVTECLETINVDNFNQILN